MPLLCVQWKTTDDGQRNFLKHVEFYSKNKFEELVHLVGFIIRIYHDAWSPEHKKKTLGFLKCVSSCLPEFFPHSNNRDTLGFFLILQMTLVWAFPEQWILSRTCNINDRVNSYGFESMHLKKIKVIILLSFPS